MSMVQIRNVPKETHRQIKARAALAGMSISEYLLREIKHSLAVPPREEILARIRQLPAKELKPSPANLVREERDSR